MPERKSYTDSCKVLQGLAVLEADGVPPLPDRMPRYDDESLGVSFFRTQLADVQLEYLTLPRTFFGRSEIKDVSFRASDLSESSANWNDFIDVTFVDADLSGTDFRSSMLERVNFQGAILRNVDLRRVGFCDCIFTGADLTGAKLSRLLAQKLQLSPEQHRVIDWQDDEGEEPEGG